MNTGVVIFVEKTCSGCLGAQNRTGIVTDEPSTHGLYPDTPGYNVAFLNGDIWRINRDAKVRILYNPLFL